MKIIACQQVPNGMIGSNNGMMGGNNGMVPMANGQNPHMPGMVPIMQSPQLPNIQGSCALLQLSMCPLLDRTAKFTVMEVHTILTHSEDAQSHNRVTEQCHTPSTTI